MVLLTANTLQSAAKLFTILIIFILVLAATYFVSKWIAGYQKMTASSGNIEVIESFRLSQNKYIAIVRLGSKYAAVAVGKDEVNLLTQLSADELTLTAPLSSADKPGFQDFMDHFRFGNRGEGMSDQAKADDPEKEKD